MNRSVTRPSSTVSCGLSRRHDGREDRGRRLFAEGDESIARWASGSEAVVCERRNRAGVVQRRDCARHMRDKFRVFLLLKDLAPSVRPDAFYLYASFPFEGCNQRCMQLRAGIRGAERFRDGNGDAAFCGAAFEKLLRKSLLVGLGHELLMHTRSHVGRYLCGQ